MLCVSPQLPPSLQRRLQAARKDLEWLLDRDYPKPGSINLVGDKYSLPRKLRNILHRGLYAKKICTQRKERLVGLERLRAKILGVDGYNVIITVESALRHQTVFLCRDGLWRDIAGSCRGPSCPPLISTIISLIMQVLKKAGPKRVDIFLDSPISGSRNLARTLKKRLSEEGLAGQAQEVLSPEKQLLDYPVVVTSDSGLIDRAGAVFDLAGYILKKCLKIPLHPF